MIVNFYAAVIDALNLADNYPCYFTNGICDQPVV
jgi:hypothetical protein